MQKVFEFLKKLNIEYKIVYHEAIFTAIDGDKFIEGLEGVKSKTLFLANKKNDKFYLFVLDDSKKLDIKKINLLLGEKLHFGSEESLNSKLGLSYGSVSLFGLLNNTQRDVKVFVDREILNERIITFHPNINTATIFIAVKDMLKILDYLGYDCNFIDV